eukprot:TRINITY_DN707_c0_g1_i1.p3 TRINITY_DN707_c0_g1~~TRINITY_DN707_c0_g1_i1.p3  ORF type:complete len:121 (-),score=20.91 TRINITY_DN707_c0_g1_i1:271-633(-)
MGEGGEVVPTTLLRDKHIAYILSLQDKQDSPEMLFADHRRLSGVYWAVSALDLLGASDRLDKETILGYVMSCYREQEGTSRSGTCCWCHADANGSFLLVFKLHGVANERLCQPGRCAVQF